ncbi:MULTISPECIES: DUF3086 domain-containing protein [Spirulina sp. CCY15215]|uniref:DUF3086 domain-containing protein n=1 Tax=Spirulina sp. CCY15215 TaxID=2767591 RepID=UPI0019501171|nr:DUF3086 domain-containing protein [Spirulina major]
MNSDEHSLPEQESSNWPSEDAAEESKLQPLPELTTLGTSSASSSSESKAVNLENLELGSSPAVSEPETASADVPLQPLPDRVSPVVKSSETQPEISSSETSETEEILASAEEKPEDVEIESVAFRVIEAEPIPPEEDNTENRQRKETLKESIADLEQRKASLEAEVNALDRKRELLLASETTAVQEAIASMILSGTKELEERRENLQAELEKLYKRRDRVREEISKSFSGVSQDISIRVQSFKNYLVGSLQDLATTAEQLDLPEYRAPREQPPREGRSPRISEPEAPNPQFAKQGFKEQQRQINSILDRYRTRPDYYGPPWQLRRTFEPIHAERVQQWFFKQGGRGTVRSMGSRLQNILIASATISSLRQIYDDRLRILVLANTPERLGEWRRGLQDCLGISRSDFGPNRGISLFESPEALVQKADRLVEEKQLPLILMDETEDMVNLSLLQFPLWLAFAPDPTQISSYGY